MPNDNLDPAIAALPARVLFADAAAAVAADQADMEAAQAAEAERQRAQEEAEEQTAEQRLAALAAVIREADPPTAEDLGVDVTGLGPCRAMLVRFAAWQKRLRDELASLETGRQNFLRQIGVPATTEAELNAFLDQERSGFFRWLKSGADPKLKPQLREFQRQELEKRLSGDSHDAEIARDSLHQADQAIAVLQRQLDILAKRHQAFLHDALLEEAEAAGQKYMAAIEGTREALTELLGLACVIGGHRGYRAGYHATQDANIPLPGFQLPCLPGYRGGPTVDLRAPLRPEIKITDGESREAARPWRDRLQALAADPRS